MRSETGFSNGLTDAQAERLAILAEECGEVIQIVGKILRHGYHSYNPTVPEMQQRPNVALLQNELGDVIWAICMMDDAADIDFHIPRTNASLNGYISRKQEKAAQYLHHQPQLVERNERERAQGDDKQRTPSPTEAPREDFPVPAKKPSKLVHCCPACANTHVCPDECTLGSRQMSQPQAGDVIAQVGFRWKVRDGSLWQRAEDGHWFEHASGQLARDIAEEAEAAIKRNAQMIVRVLLEEAIKSIGNRHPTSAQPIEIYVREAITEAVRNLGLEVSE